MNPLFFRPIHGIACAPYCDPQSLKVRHELNVGEGVVALEGGLAPIWQMQDEGERYQTHVALYKVEPNKLVLKIDCQGSGLFEFKDNRLTIDWQDEGTDAAHYFQTLGVALWLELNQVLCIHANALACGDAAIALMAPSRGGKTTMSAALCQQGFAWMTDDMIALHGLPDEHKADEIATYQIYPSWPVARMWPDGLSRLQVYSGKADNGVEHRQQYTKVHQQFAKRQVNVDNEAGFDFCDTPKALRVIYLLNRVSPAEYQAYQGQQQGMPIHGEQDAGVCHITAVPAAKALMLLLQNSILGSAYRALNMEQGRLKALADLLQTVQCKQVTYPSGGEYLDTISQAIKEDCTGL
jgi:hypothetical protein